MANELDPSRKKTRRDAAKCIYYAADEHLQWHMIHNLSRKEKRDLNVARLKISQKYLSMVPKPIWEHVLTTPSVAQKIFHLSNHGTQALDTFIKFPIEKKYGIVNTLSTLIKNAEYKSMTLSDKDVQTINEVPEELKGTLLEMLIHIGEVRRSRRMGFTMSDSTIAYYKCCIDLFCSSSNIPTTQNSRPDEVTDVNVPSDITISPLARSFAHCMEESPRFKEFVLTKLADPEFIEESAPRFQRLNAFVEVWKSAPLLKINPP